MIEDEGSEIIKFTETPRIKELHLLEKKAFVLATTISIADRMGRNTFGEREKLKNILNELEIESRKIR